MIKDKNIEKDTLIAFIKLMIRAKKKFWKIITLPIFFIILVIFPTRLILTLSRIDETKAQNFSKHLDLITQINLWIFMFLLFLNTFKYIKIFILRKLLFYLTFEPFNNNLIKKWIKINFKFVIIDKELSVFIRVYNKATNLWVAPDIFRSNVEKEIYKNLKSLLI